MSQEITSCVKCNSRNYTIIDNSGMNSDRIVCSIKAKCNDCEEEFTYTTFTDEGLIQRNKGMIL